MKITKLLAATVFAILANYTVQATEEDYTLIEDFDDGNGGALVEYSPFGAFGAPATFDYSGGVLTMTAPASPAPQISDQVIGLYVQQPQFTDGTASIDVWNWDTETVPVFFLNGRSTDGANGTYNFYSVNFDPVPFPAGTGLYRKTPGLTILKWVNNQPQLPSLATVDLTDLELDPTQRYRLTFKIEGTTLSAQLIKPGEMPEVLATVTAEDDSYSSGRFGFFITDKATKGDPAGNNPVQISVDNFSVSGEPVSTFVQVSEDFDDASAEMLTQYQPFAPFGAPATYTFADGGLTITAPASPAPQISDQVVGMYLDQPRLSDGTSSIDLWNWDTTTVPVFFLNGRSTEAGGGTYNFYSVNFDPVPFPNATGLFRSTPGLTILKWINNQPQLPSLATVDLTGVELDPTQRHRLTFTMEGTSLSAQLIRLGETPEVLATVSAVDSSYSSGSWGFYITDKASRGEPMGNNPVQVSVDNFKVEGVAAAPELSIQRAVVISWPAPALGPQYVLQRASSAGGQWTDVSTAAAVNGVVTVTVLVEDGMQLFRLREAGE